MRRSSIKAIAVTCLLGAAILLSSGSGGCKKKQAAYPDLSNPRAAAVTFARAMETDDVKVAQDASLAGGMEVELVEAMTHATAALKELVRVTKAKVGDADSSMLRGTGAMDASAALATGELVQESDERATLTPEDGRAVIPLQRTEDGTWKVDIGALIRGDDVNRSIPLLKAVTTAAKDVSAQVQAGKFKDAAEVKTALQARIIQIANQAGMPTTLPASPTSLPAGGG